MYTCQQLEADTFADTLLTRLHIYIKTNRPTVAATRWDVLNILGFLCKTAYFCCSLAQKKQKIYRFYTPSQVLNPVVLCYIQIVVIESCCTLHRHAMQFGPLAAGNFGKFSFGTCPSRIWKWNFIVCKQFVLWLWYWKVCSLYFFVVWVVSKLAFMCVVQCARMLASQIHQHSHYRSNLAPCRALLNSFNDFLCTYAGWQIGCLNWYVTFHRLAINQLID